MSVLYTWVGGNDRYPNQGKRGPVLDSLLHLKVDDLSHVVLLYDYKEDEDDGENYRKKLEIQLSQNGKGDFGIILEKINKKEDKKQSDPTEYNWVYDNMRRVIGKELNGSKVTKRHYLLGPGTPTMTACTLVLSRLKGYEGTLWQVDAKNASEPVRKVQLPFQVSFRDGVDPDVYQSGAITYGEHNGYIIASPSTQHARRLAERAAKSAYPVLILGNTGTGKEDLAQHLHKESGRDKLITRNCGAFPENLIEAELFGHTKGAFTDAKEDQPGIFEAAGNGTVFLDEVGELPLSAQVKFLRVLQEKKVTRVGEKGKERLISCRIIAATHRNLWQFVQDGRFRSDLYYRLAGLIITLEDLAKRPDDLKEMINIFWKEVVNDNPGFPGRTLSDEAFDRLMAHHWPGNVRELKATLARVCFNAEGPNITVADVETSLDKSSNECDKPSGAATDAKYPQVVPPISSASSTLEDQVRLFRRQLVLNAIKEEEVVKLHGSKTRAAHKLGLTPTHLGRILKE